MSIRGSTAECLNFPEEGGGETLAWIGEADRSTDVGLRRDGFDSAASFFLDQHRREPDESREEETSLRNTSDRP